MRKARNRNRSPPRRRRQLPQNGMWVTQRAAQVHPAGGIVTETEFGRATWWGRLPAWSSSPTADIASRRRSSSTRFGYTSVLHSCVAVAAPEPRLQIEHAVPRRKGNDDFRHQRPSRRREGRILLEKVRTFDASSEEHDPHHEHDFGAFEEAGIKCSSSWDYYDWAMQFGSEDPTDPSKTTQVLTIMLCSASSYRREWHSRSGISTRCGRVGELSWLG
jgi:hypothetical protein